MTATVPTATRWRYPQYQLPGTRRHDLAERIVESQLVAGSEDGTTDPDVALAIIASVTGRTPERALELVNLLLDLADAVNDATDFTPHEVWLAAVDEYSDTLYAATRPSDDFEQHVLTTPGMQWQMGIPADELAARRPR